MLKDRIVVMAQGIARSYNTTATVDFTDSVPPVINSSSLIPLAMAAAHATVGKTKVMPLPKANMGAEDFGNYLEHVPGVFVRYGAAIEGRIVGGAHTSTWDFNEEALMIGAAYLAEVVTRFKVDI
jgi:metal-dependent amidase/aminoacylase/carboxypeptidase family protein